MAWIGYDIGEHWALSRDADGSWIKTTTDGGMNWSKFEIPLPGWAFLESTQCGSLYYISALDTLVIAGNASQAPFEPGVWLEKDNPTLILSNDFGSTFKIVNLCDLLGVNILGRMSSVQLTPYNHIQVRLFHHQDILN